MTRTRKVVQMLVLFLAFEGAIFAGGHKDYEVVQGNVMSGGRPLPFRTLENTIYYDTAFASLELKERREDYIRWFFIRFNAPAAKYAKLFVQVADENELDWSLLPAIAFIESSGGKYQRNHNIFGWDSGRAKFKSAEDCIRHVARALTLGPYKDKTTLEKIQLYNHYVKYHIHTQKVMNTIRNLTF